MKQLIPVCLLTFTLFGAASAATVFDFRNDVGLYTALDDQAGPVSVTDGSLIATFTASDGTMNRTTGGFGVNSVSLGSDDTVGFDIGEWLDITFSASVTLTNVKVSSWSTVNGDQAAIYVGGISNGVITSTGDHAFNIGVATGQVLRIASTTGVFGNGWSLDSIAIQVASGGNNPPILNAIGNKSLAVSNALNFSVTASDADNDPIILSASNLPPGAVFNTVTNAGNVTNTFIWASAAPAGVYTTSFYAVDGTTNAFEIITITVTNAPIIPLTGAVWTVTYNLPQQSSSPTDYPDQFRIRNTLASRINALQSGNSAALSTFTFSADEGAGTIINAMNAALDRGALISFVADSSISLGTIYGGTNSLLSLSTRPSNPLTLAVASSSSGIMHDKLGLFDYGGTNQWVFTASWNFTLAASANQWNIGLEASSPELYSIYTSETAEFLAGRFHDNPAKSHAHDGATFTLDGSWGTNFVRFAPYPDATQGGNNAERDITNLIAQAQGNIVFALNKLNRTPIRDALVAAANRGVVIKGVMPKSDTDPGGVSSAVYSYLTNSNNYATTNIVHMLPAYSKADYSALDTGESDLIHAKYMVIDPELTNAIVIHGSANWTAEALVSSNDNDENTVFLRHNEIAAKFYEDFQRITGTGLFAAGNSTIVSWNFTDSNITADGGISANTNSTVRRIPAPSPTNFISGALSVNGWDSGANTKYWETDFSSLQHTNIKVSSKQTSTTTGPVHFKLQYKIGAGGTYSDVTNSTITAGTGWGGQLTLLPLPAACENQTNIFLRWLMTSNIAVNGSSVGSSGASRIDDIIVTGTAYDLPPVLNSIGNQSVFESLPLSFSVTASDPIDSDPITLSATNLPTGAIFTDGLFSWSNAVPVGTYAVTFYAADKDGSDSETVTITVSPLPQLFISEIADPAGTGGDVYRFVELYNAGTNTINLASNGWTLARQNNGIDWTDIPLTGTVAAASSYVIAKGTNFYTACGFYPQQMNSGVDGNGNDAYVLYHGGGHTNGTLIDIYGQKDTDGTGTAWEYTDSRAVRKNSILQPNAVWTASEWTLTPNAATSNMTPGLHGPLPEFQGLENPFVFLGDGLNLTVTAVNTVRTDVITLSAAALPSNATFTTATGTNAVSSTLNWNSPTAGVYTATFAAAGAAGTNTASITITVTNRARIAGYFYGWSGDTIFKLDNGQFWQQILSGTKTFTKTYRPYISITNEAGLYKLSYSNSAATVAQIHVIESTVTNSFTGLHYQNIYQLADGTTWQQVSFENISSNTSSAKAWRWISGGAQKIRFLAADDAVIGTCTVEISAPPADTTIHSEIDGWFRGWQNKRVFALKNGQFWQQTSLDSSTEALYSPAVTLTNWLQSGNWRMSIDGLNGYISVQQLTNVVRTAVDRWFYGFGHGSIFPLTDGSWWKQTSSETSTSTRFNPEVLIWSENGIDYLEMPDEGRNIAAEQLNVQFESAVTNAFTGLHYGNLYRLDSAGDWLQLSFENVATNTDTPGVMLWKDGAQTNMLVRDSRDVTIGTCIVVDPAIDSDGDGLSNADEVLAGFDPLDEQSRFELHQTNRYILSWNAVEGRIYTIAWALSLTDSFQTLENNIAWPQNSWTDTVHAVETKGFYRIGVRLAE